MNNTFKGIGVCGGLIALTAFSGASAPQEVQVQAIGIAITYRSFGSRGPRCGGEHSRRRTAHHSRHGTRHTSGLGEEDCGCDHSGGITRDRLETTEMRSCACYARHLDPAGDLALSAGLYVAVISAAVALAFGLHGGNALVPAAAAAYDVAQEDASNCPQ